jgi:hypothetical protein
MLALALQAVFYLFVCLVIFLLVATVMCCVQGTTDSRPRVSCGQVWGRKVFYTIVINSVF